jgi:CBS domain-containing protein
MNAADVMVSNVITVRSDAAVEVIADILLTNRISAVPVVSETGALLGIVSEGDLIHRVEAGTERHRSWWLEMFTGKDLLAREFVKSHGRKATDVMTSPVISVAPDTALGTIAFLLEKHRIKRVPVVKGGKLVGIVSRANLVQAIVRLGNKIPQAASVEDSTLHDKIISELQSKMWANPANINLSVKDGKVELWGLVESELEKNAVRVAVEVMPGVREVQDHLAVGRVISGL